MTKLTRIVCSGMVALALLLGAAGTVDIATIGAQEATETAQDTEVTPPVTQVETDEGFDDWGLLGLAGLLGLLGLRRQPERTVTTVDRTSTARPIVNDRP